MGRLIINVPIVAEEGSVYQIMLGISIVLTRHSRSPSLYICVGNDHPTIV